MHKIRKHVVIWRFKCEHCGNYDCNENESRKHIERMWISSGDMEIKGIKNEKKERRIREW